MIGSSNRSRLFFREMRCALTARITNCRVQQSASGAIFQAGNGCAAHPSRRLLTRRPKTGSLFVLFTNMVDGQNITCSFGAVLKMGVVYAGASGVCS